MHYLPPTDALPSTKHFLLRHRLHMDQIVAAAAFAFDYSELVVVAAAVAMMQ